MDTSLKDQEAKLRATNGSSQPGAYSCSSRDPNDEASSTMKKDQQAKLRATPPPARTVTSNKPGAYSCPNNTTEESLMVGHGSDQQAKHKAKLGASGPGMAGSTTRRQPGLARNRNTSTTIHASGSSRAGNAKKQLLRRANTTTGATTRAAATPQPQPGMAIAGIPGAHSSRGLSNNNNNSARARKIQSFESSAGSSSTPVIVGVPPNLNRTSTGTNMRTRAGTTTTSAAAAASQPGMAIVGMPGAHATSSSSNGTTRPGAYAAPSFASRGLSNARDRKLQAFGCATSAGNSRSSSPAPTLAVPDNRRRDTTGTGTGATHQPPEVPMVGIPGAHSCSNSGGGSSGGTASARRARKIQSFGSATATTSSSTRSVPDNRRRERRSLQEDSSYSNNNHNDDHHDLKNDNSMDQSEEDLLNSVLSDRSNGISQQIELDKLTKIQNKMSYSGTSSASTRTPRRARRRRTDRISASDNSSNRGGASLLLASDDADLEATTSTNAAHMRSDPEMAILKAVAARSSRLPGDNNEEQGGNSSGSEYEEDLEDESSRRSTTRTPTKFISRYSRNAKKRIEGPLQPGAYDAAPGEQLCRLRTLSFSDINNSYNNNNHGSNREEQEEGKLRATTASASATSITASSPQPGATAVAHNSSPVVDNRRARKLRSFGAVSTTGCDDGLGQGQQQLSVTASAAAAAASPVVDNNRRARKIRSFDPNNNYHRTTSTDSANSTTGSNRNFHRTISNSSAATTGSNNYRRTFSTGSAATSAGGGGGPNQVLLVGLRRTNTRSPSPMRMRSNSTISASEMDPTDEGTKEKIRAGSDSIPTSGAISVANDDHDNDNYNNRYMRKNSREQQQKPYRAPPRSRAGAFSESVTSVCSEFDVMDIVKERASDASLDSMQQQMKEVQKLFRDSTHSSSGDLKLVQQERGSFHFKKDMKEVDVDALQVVQHKMMKDEVDVDALEDVIKMATFAGGDHRSGAFDVESFAGSSCLSLKLGLSEDDGGHVDPPNGLEAPPYHHQDPDNVDNLAVARPVNEDSESPSQLNLQLAEQVDHEDEEYGFKKRKKRRRANRGCYLIGFGIALVVVVGVILLLVFLLGGQQGDNGNGITEPPTQPPTPAPTQQSMEDYVLSLLPESSVRAMKYDDESPQSMAYQWLVNDTTSALMDYPTWRILQRYALATFYFAMGGDEWTRNTKWLEYEHHECDWFSMGEFSSTYGIKKTQQFLNNSNFTYIQTEYPTPCEQDPSSNATATRGGDGDEGRFKHLWLYENSLRGSLPEELSLLTSLRSISINGKTVSGTVPTEFGQLTKLEAISLPQFVEGTVPTELGMLSNSLSYLNFIAGAVEGNIPSQLGLCKKLRFLLMDTNRLTGSIPLEVWTLPNLHSLLLYDNELTGTIPAEVGNTSSLEFLYLNNNNFTGSLPSQLGKIRKMQDLRLYENQLTGSLPTEVGRMSSLQVMLLYKNNMTGPIPSHVGKMRKLKTLRYHDNQVTGTLPTEVRKMSALKYLLLYKNSMTGAIPSKIGKMSDLEDLRLHENQFTGTVPTEIAKMSSLQVLRLNNNDLRGAVPSQLAAMSNLEDLRLNDNSFFGTLATEFETMSNLKVLSLQNNNLFGPVYSALSSKPELQPQDEGHDAGGTEVCS